MEEIQYSQKEIAIFFSNGNFELTYPYLSEKVEWNIIGENQFKGKSNVIQNCEKTTQYFKAVQTNFKTEDIIISGNKVMIRGIGEFLKDGEKVNLIKACDVYEFNKNSELEHIYSYCIPEKK
ncbi:MAG: hypothetical protein ACFB0B_03790 [Thermonemataceae bacterium]